MENTSNTNLPTDEFILSKYLKELDFDKLDHQQKKLALHLQDMHLAYLELQAFNATQLKDIYNLLVNSMQNAVDKGTASADFKRLIISLDQIAKIEKTELADNIKKYNSASNNIISSLKETGIE